MRIFVFINIQITTLNKTNTQFQNICIVGLGGLGTQVIDYLFINQTTQMHSDAIVVTQNLKCLTLVDFDIVESKNLENQRYDKHSVGQSKVKAQIIMLQEIMQNRSIKLQAFNSRIQDIPHIIQVQDLIIGCLDNIAGRQFIATTIQPHILVLDLGSEQFQGTIRFYGWYFKEFSDELFINEEDKPIPLCQHQNTEISGQINYNELSQQENKQNQQSIITYSEVNRYIVNKGFQYMNQVIQLNHLGLNAQFDMIHISFQEIYFEQEILLRQQNQECVVVDLANRRILKWDALNITPSIQSSNYAQNIPNIVDIFI